MTSRPAINHACARSASYPSYVSFDGLVDVERLRALDGILRERISEHISRQKETLFLNQHRLEASSPHEPGVREIWLRRTKPGVPYDYLDIDRTDLWEWADDVAKFAPLLNFINELPFDSLGRILIIYDDAGNSVPAHRDHTAEDVCHDFIWFRTALNKPFYLLNNVTGDKSYVEGYSAWFDTVNQYHGSDAGEGLTFSLRVDGHFTAELRSRIPFYRADLAASPAICAANGGIH